MRKLIFLTKILEYSVALAGVFVIHNHRISWKLSASSADNHNHYNFLKCNWCMSCFIFHELFYTVVIGRWNRKGGCNWTAIATNHTKSTQLNPPITKLTTITISATTYPKRKLGNFQNRGIFTSDALSTGDIFPKSISFFLFFGNCNGYD